jgi:predicted nucleic acid-binding protein
MIVVSDTSPLCYLLLIEQIHLLPLLYNRVVIPQAVREELRHESSPAVVQAWIRNPPKWLEVQEVDLPSNPGLSSLDLGEQEAIFLLEQLKADLIVLDDLQGRKVARSRNLRVTGLLGVLEEVARQNLVDLPAALERLQQTTFRASPQLIQLLLDRRAKNPN